MEEPSLLAQTITWLLPLALLTAFGFFLRHTNRSYKRHVDHVNEINEKILVASEDMVAELKEIKALLKEQK